MRIGLALPHYDFSFPDGSGASIARVVDYARRCEDMGFDSVWVSDHLFLDLARYGGPARRYTTPEAMAMLSAIAAATERVRIGSLVLCAAFRNPAVLAEQARSIQEASGGRLELGIGAGWNEAEFAEAGIPFGSAGDRIRRLAEVAAVLRARIEGDGLRMWIGGKGGPKIMRIVAEHAHGWNVVWQMTPEDYGDRLDTLADACASAGRDPATVGLSVGLSTLIGEDEGDLARRYAGLQRWAPGGALDEVDLEGWARGRLVGTVDEAAARIEAFEALGVSDIVVGPANVPFSVYEDDQLDLIARELIPRAR
jgi:alkanesulfonate monooxygenase SsuD/methylene tetrahydromethanopterin reductase-like flavin-dependent oxidoreductase (luciferase family)